MPFRSDPAPISQNHDLAAIRIRLAQLAAEEAELTRMLTAAEEGATPRPRPGWPIVRMTPTQAVQCGKPGVSWHAA